MSHVTVTDLAELHLDQCADVFVAAFAAPPWDEDWPGKVARRRLAELMTTPGSVGLVALEDELCIGFVLGFVESFHPADRFQLSEMVVDPSKQRTGVGSMLVATLVERLSSMDVTEIYLVTGRGAPEEFWASSSFVSSRGRVVMVRRSRASDEHDR